MTSFQGRRKERDWIGCATLFAPGARLIPTGPNQAGGYGHVCCRLTITSRDPSRSLQEGFFETEFARTTKFGQIAHVSVLRSAPCFRRRKTLFAGINQHSTDDDGKRVGCEYFLAGEMRKIRYREILEEG